MVFPIKKSSYVLKSNLQIRLSVFFSGDAMNSCNATNGMEILEKPC